jgi:alpha-glucosidase
MKKSYYIKLFMTFFAAWLISNLPANANNIGTTISPDGKNVVNILLDDAGSLSYTVTRTGQTLISSSSMGLNADSEDFGKGLIFESSNNETINENYTLPTGKTSKYTNHCNETTFNFSKDKYKLKIVVRCYNDGIAFRYIINGNGTINITGEKSEVQIPTLTTCWGEQYVSDYSTQYPARSWVETTALPDHKMCAPILVKSSIGDDAWALITESAVLGSYSTSAMISGDVSEIGKFTYQPQSDASVTLPFTSPWRTVYIGNLRRNR